MTRGKKITAAIAALLPVVGLAGLLSARSVCGCADASYNWSAMGVQALYGPLDTAQAQLREKLPVGSTAGQVNAFLNSVTHGHAYTNKICTQAPRTIDCDVLTLEEWWGFRKTGFRVHFVLDAAGRLTDSRIQRYREWFNQPS